ncbi:MAG: hypothetical protein WC460_01520 [Patescibacteria group bacterium]
MIPEDKIYEKQLGFSYWYVTHKLLLKTIITIILLVINFGLIAYFLFLAIFNLAIFQKSYQAILNDLVSANPDYAILRQFNLPPEIKVESITTLQNTVGYDIVAEISNANDKWYATFDYQFKIGAELTPVRKEFIYPGETKKIVNLSVVDGNLASEAVISNVIWQKEIDFAQLYQEKFKFNIKDVKFIPAQELGLGEKVPVSRVSLTIENLSAYNYKNINLLITLSSGGQPAALTQFPSSTLASGASRNLDINFFQRLPKIDKVEVIPEANIFDESIFLKY